MRLQPLLNKTGMTISLTRFTDVFVELADRAKHVNDQNADVFISVHANSFTDASANDIETYYYGLNQTRSNGEDNLGKYLNLVNPLSDQVQDSRLLTEKIQARLVERLQLRDRGVKHGNFHVIREINMVAVLVELDFM